MSLSFCILNFACGEISYIPFSEALSALGRKYNKEAVAIVLSTKRLEITSRPIWISLFHSLWYKGIVVSAFVSSLPPIYTRLIYCGRSMIYCWTVTFICLAIDQWDTVDIYTPNPIILSLAFPSLSNANISTTRSIPFWYLIPFVWHESIPLATFYQSNQSSTPKSSIIQDVRHLQSDRCPDGCLHGQRPHDHEQPHPV